MLMSVAYAIAAIFLVCFVAYVASLVWRRGGATNVWGSLALGGGMLAAAFWMLAAMLLWVLARPWTPDQPNLVRAMHDLTYLLGGPAHVVMLGLFVAAGAVSLPRDMGVPAALRWVGLAGAAVSLLSVAALLFDPASLVLPIGRGLTLLWIAGVGVTLAWNLRRARERVVSRPSPIAGSRAR